MKKTCCLLLLSFCATAISICATKDSGRTCMQAGTSRPQYFPYEYSCQPPSRLAPLFTVANPLNLSTEQLAGVASLFENHQPVLQPLLRKFFAVREKIHQSTRTGIFDEASTHSFQQRVQSLLAEILVERERLDAKLYAVLSREQQKQAEEILQSIEILLSGENNTPHLASVVAERMNTLLSLTNDQAANVAEAIDTARRQISPLGRTNNANAQCLSCFRFFNDSEARNRANRQAEKMAAILIVSERTTAKMFQLLGEAQREMAGEKTNELESCIRTRILCQGEKDSAINLRPMKGTGATSRLSGSTIPRQVSSITGRLPGHPPWQRLARPALTSTQY